MYNVLYDFAPPGHLRFSFIIYKPLIKLANFLNYFSNLIAFFLALNLLIYPIEKAFEWQLVFEKKEGQLMDTIQETVGTGLQVPPHILLMEDELSVAKGLETILTEEGYDVDLAMTGRSALDKFGENVFDLLVADIRLPDMDGLDVVRQVKDASPDTEAIVITGYPSVSSAVNAVKIGAFEYLRKPFTDDEFMGAVGGALQKKKEASMEQLLLETEKGRLIQKNEVIRVLNRTTEDLQFWRDLMEKGSIVLEGYQLSWRAKAAIVSGDLQWIKKNVGELTPNQLRFIYKRLEREAW